MPFLRQSYKQKQQAWGPVSAVQASIFENAERIGIDPAYLFLGLPFWEKAGQSAKNYLGAANASLPVGGQYSLGKSGLISTASTSYGINLGETVERSNNMFFLFFICSNTHTASECCIYRKQDADGYSISVGFVSGLLRCLMNGSLEHTWFVGHDRTILTMEKEHSYALSWDGLEQYEYQDTTYLGGGGVRGTLLGGNSDVYINSGYGGISSIAGNINLLIAGTLHVKASQIAYLSDNPYFLLQRVAPVYYSVPASLNLTQYAFRFRNDNGDETSTGSGATYAANENTNVTLTPGSKTRIRIGIDATGDPISKQFQLEYRHKPSGESFGTWGAVT